MVTVDKKNALRERLVKATLDHINRDGLKHLRARDIAQDAGCAVGSIYNMFDDLDELVLYVNKLTLQEIGDHVQRRLAGIGDPAEQLKQLAVAYKDYALANRNRWAALFEHYLPNENPLPKWYEEALEALFAIIREPIASLEPNLEEMEVAIRANTAFAAIHGIVSVSLAERFVGVPEDRLEDELLRFTQQAVTGRQ